MKAQRSKNRIITLKEDLSLFKKTQQKKFRVIRHYFKQIKQKYAAYPPRKLLTLMKAKRK